MISNELLSILIVLLVSCFFLLIVICIYVFDISRIIKELEIVKNCDTCGYKKFYKEIKDKTKKEVEDE